MTNETNNEQGESQQYEDYILYGDKELDEEIQRDKNLKIKAEIERNNKKARAKLNLPFAERLIKELEK